LIKGGDSGGGGVVSTGEDEESGEVFSEDLLGCGLVEVHDGGEGVVIDPRFNGINGEFSGIVQLGFFEGSEKNHSVLGDSVFGGEGGVESVGKDNVIENFGNIEISLEGFGGGVGTEVGDGNFGLGLESFNFFFGLFFSGSWGDLLFNPLNDGGFGSSSGVVRGFSVNEPFKSGESLNSESGSEFLMFGGINISENDFGFLV